MRVLVVAEGRADSRKTLAAVRALGDSGHDVEVASDSDWHPASWSRGCGRRLRCPDPRRADGAFGDWLIARLSADAYDALLPLSDHTTLPAVERADELCALTATALPDLPTLRLAHDKLATLTRAARVGLDVPRTEHPRDRRALLELAPTIAYPCVVKRRRGAGGEDLAFPGTARELLAHYDRCAAKPGDPLFGRYEPLVQEFVPGAVHDVCCLFNRGEPRAVLTQRRILMYPQAGGVGIYNETTDDPRLRELASSLLRDLRWHGPAQVEFKRDERDGAYKLMEINGRFWGTLDLAIQAGIDFPALTCRLAIDGDVAPVPRYQVGLRYRWPWPLGMRFARESDRVWSSLASWVAPSRSVRSDLRWTDPLPNLIGFARRP